MQKIKEMQQNMEKQAERIRAQHEEIRALLEKRKLERVKLQIKLNLLKEVI